MCRTKLKVCKQGLVAVCVASMATWCRERLRRVWVCIASLAGYNHDALTCASWNLAWILDAYLIKARYIMG